MAPKEKGNKKQSKSENPTTAGEDQTANEGNFKAPNTPRKRGRHPKKTGKTKSDSGQQSVSDFVTSTPRQCKEISERNKLRLEELNITFTRDRFSSAPDLSNITYEDVSGPKCLSLESLKLNSEVFSPDALSAPIAAYTPLSRNLHSQARHNFLPTMERGLNNKPAEHDQPLIKCSSQINSVTQQAVSVSSATIGVSNPTTTTTSCLQTMPTVNIQANLVNATSKEAGAINTATDSDRSIIDTSGSTTLLHTPRPLHSAQVPHQIQGHVYPSLVTPATNMVQPILINSEAGPSTQMATVGLGDVYSMLTTLNNNMTLMQRDFKRTCEERELLESEVGILKHIQREDRKVIVKMHEELLRSSRRVKTLSNLMVKMENDALAHKEKEVQQTKKAWKTHMRLKGYSKE